MNEAKLKVPERMQPASLTGKMNIHNQQKINAAKNVSVRWPIVTPSSSKMT